MDESQPVRHPVLYQEVGESVDVIVDLQCRRVDDACVIKKTEVCELSMPEDALTGLDGEANP